MLDATVIRMPKTYPAYFGTYDRFDEVRRFTDRFANLFLLGRNGMHRYNNQDHSMLTAMVAVDNIVAGGGDKANVWAVNTEQDYHEAKGFAASKYKLMQYLLFGGPQPPHEDSAGGSRRARRSGWPTYPFCGCLPGRCRRGTIRSAADYFCLHGGELGVDGFEPFARRPLAGRSARAKDPPAPAAGQPHRGGRRAVVREDVPQ